MEGCGTQVVSMKEFMCSVDKTSLPRVLQVCSGVYFQGSVYELSGSEVCLSTGDLLQVIGLELMAVSTEDAITKETCELPLNYTGLFRLVQEEMPYRSLEELVALMPQEPEDTGSFSFTSMTKITLQGCTVEPGEVLTPLSVESQEQGEPVVRCGLQGCGKATTYVLLPLSLQGEFLEKNAGNSYSLQDIVASPRLCSRRFYHVMSNRSMGPMYIFPIYQVQAIMHLRKEVVKFPSSLEVDVVDVTEQSKDVTFVIPKTLSDVMAAPPDILPCMAEVLGWSEQKPLLKTHWAQALRCGQQLVLHGCKESQLVLASTSQSKRAPQHFILSQQYKGRFRRRPREFSSVFELAAAARHTSGFVVAVSKHCEAPHEGVESLSAGDQIEVLRREVTQLPGSDEKQEVLVCKHLLEVDSDDDDDDDNEQEESNREISLLMYMEGHFVEKLKDNKKYSLSSLVERFPLPLDVKVVGRDTGLESDPLSDLAFLKLKEVIVEPMVQASLAERPAMCFDLPSRWLSLSICLTEDPLPWSKEQAPQLCWESVSEVTEDFYYELHKMTSSFEPPPPLPPKQCVVATPKKPKPGARKPNKAPLTKHIQNMTLSADRPMAPPKIAEPPEIPAKPSKLGQATEPNTYVQTPKKACHEPM